jgi:S-adenosylmethionine:tRNA ribosyltransferase-isomerase
MRVDAFDFDLPDDNIALRPASPRDAARLLVVPADDGFRHRSVSDLPSELRAGDALVFNDTRVLPAQLTGIRDREGTSAKVGATLHLRTAPDTWKAFVRGAKKLAEGETVTFGPTLDAKITAKAGSEVTFAFNQSENRLDEALATFGVVPLPPYIAQKRAIDERDSEDYQTVYARDSGAVAAPTAGLHFTESLLAELERCGIEKHFVTLHVGAGTFLPVKADDTKDHVMHEEWGEVSAETAAALNAVRARGNRVVGVGTTSLRLLESAVNEGGQIQPWSGTTDIFITPGYRFRAIDALMTNFHLPRSTLFMLVSAFSGIETMRSAYETAIAEGYRFYSYGDSSLLWPKREGE